MTKTVTLCDVCGTEGAEGFSMFSEVVDLCAKCQKEQLGALITALPVRERVQMRTSIQKGKRIWIPNEVTVGAQARE